MIEGDEKSERMKVKFANGRWVRVERGVRQSRGLKPGVTKPSVLNEKEGERVLTLL